LANLARRLAATNLYIGNDSGITHVAAAVGCTTLAIFGATDPSIWAPKGMDVTVLRGDPWPSLEDVLAAGVRLTQNFCAEGE
jgi:ADP-heptose:LPS heptosyltransferase